MNRIRYTCKNCGWSTSVVSQWADLKPKRCMNAKCNTSFVKESQSLIIEDPTRKAKSVKTEVKFDGKPKKPEPKLEVQNEKTNSKSKTSSKTKQSKAK